MLGKTCAYAQVGKGNGRLDAMNRVFLPVDEKGQPVQKAEKPAGGAERRRHTRHQYTCELEIQLEKPGSRYSAYDAVSFEISEGGMSAATPNILFMGERV